MSYYVIFYHIILCSFRYNTPMCMSVVVCASFSTYRGNGNPNHTPLSTIAAPTRIEVRAGVGAGLAIGTGKELADR